MWGTLCLIFLFVNSAQGVSNGDCYLNGVNDTHWLTSYKNDPVDDFEEREFKRFWAHSITDVELHGDDYRKYFAAKIKSNRFILFPTKAFKSFEINEKSAEEPEMYIRLKFHCKTGIRLLSFYQPVRDHNTYCPEFDKLSYTYNLPMPLPGKFDVSVYGEPIVACDWDISNVRVHFAISPAEDFSLSWDGPINDTNKCHKGILRTINPLRLTFDKVYEITVTDSGIPPRSNFGKLEVKRSENASLPLNPHFEYAYYTATYNVSEDGKDAVVVNEPIRLKNGCSKIQLHLIEFEAYFRVRCKANEIILELINDFPGDLLDNMTVLLVTIVATLEHAEAPGRTVVVAKLPQKECPETTTLTSTTVCSSTMISTECPTCSVELTDFRTCPSCDTTCPSTPTEGSPCLIVATDCPSNLKSRSALIISFTQDNYWFDVEFSFQGIVGVVEAVAVPEEVLEYFISPDEPFVAVDKTTGILEVTEEFDIGTYNFIAYAQGVHSKITAQAHVIINVVRGVERLITLNSLLIERVAENEGRYIKFSCQCDYCAYVIVEQYPETNPKLFRVYNKTHIYAVPVNREMDEIVNMKVPQFTLQLVLTALIGCSVEHSSNVLNSSLKQDAVDTKVALREWAFVPSRMFNKPNELLMSVIVEDVNDNPPLFQAGDKLVTGYPVKELDAQISPPYLAKAVATDLDAGENAEIRYSTKSLHFIVHPKTGVIYPGGNWCEDESCLKFNITATDRNGANDGLSTSLMVKVKLLKQNHLLVLTVRNILLEDIDEALAKLSNETNIKMKCLTAAVIPVVNRENLTLAKSSYSKLTGASFSRIVIYGLNAEDEPVENVNLQKMVKDSEVFEEFTVEQLKPVALSDYKDGKTFNKTNFLISIVILSVLLVFFIIASATFYYFTVYQFRKLKRRTFVEEAVNDCKRNLRDSKKCKTTVEPKASEVVSSPSSSQENSNKPTKNKVSRGDAKLEEEDKTSKEESEEDVIQLEVESSSTEFKSSGRKSSRKTV